MSHRGDVGVDIPQEASQAHSPMLNSDPSSIQPPRCDKASAAAVQEETHIDPRLSTPQSSVGDNETLVPDRGSACHEIGAINAMGMAQLTPDSQADADNRLFSNPSAASLLCNIQDQCQQQSRSSVIYQDPATETPQPARRKLSTLHSQNDDDYHLPPRNVADHLLRLYWERVQNVYPFLHWPTLEAAYKRLWLSESEIAQLPELVGVGIGSRSCSVVVFYCAINAIFALASQFTEGLEHERKERSLPFVRRSRHLMRLDFLDNADICLVQALLVFARYLQTTNFPSRCRNVVGVAYRMAQSLDLGNEVDRGEMSMLEIEMRRRVWHSCTSLDTYDKHYRRTAADHSVTDREPLIESWACSLARRAATPTCQRFHSREWQTRRFLLAACLVVLIRALLHNRRTSFAMQLHSDKSLAAF